MNFRTIGLGLATAAAMTTGAVLAESPAYAFLTGKLVVNLENQVQAVDSGFINFSNTLNNVGIGLSPFSQGNLATYTNVKIKDFSTSLASVPIEDFIQLSGSATLGNTSFKLLELINPNFLDVGVVGDGLGSFQAKLRGVFSTGQAGSSPVDTVVSFRFESTTNGGRLELTPIPTPALLPAALGMGVAALRKKRKQEADADLASEPVEA